jgi:hypothetical protein
MRIGLEAIAGLLSAHEVDNLSTQRVHLRTEYLSRRCADISLPSDEGQKLGSSLRRPGGLAAPGLQHWYIVASCSCRRHHWARSGGTNVHRTSTNKPSYFGSCISSCRTDRDGSSYTYTAGRNPRSPNSDSRTTDCNPRSSNSNAEA